MNAPVDVAAEARVDAVEIAGLTLALGGRPVLRDVSLSIRAAEVVHNEVTWSTEISRLYVHSCVWSNQNRVT